MCINGHFIIFIQNITSLTDFATHISYNDDLHYFSSIFIAPAQISNISTSRLKYDSTEMRLALLFLRAAPRDLCRNLEVKRAENLWLRFASSTNLL